MRRPIAVFNASDDVIEAIAVALEMAGFEAVGAHVLDFQYIDIEKVVDAVRRAALLVESTGDYSASLSR